jgi:integrase/recombinase XerD
MADFDLGAMIGGWELSLKARHLSSGTIRGYLKSLKDYRLYCERAGEIPDLSRRQVQAWIVEALEARELEATTMQGRLTAVKSLSAWCAKEGEIDQDAIKDIEPPKVGHRVRMPLTDEELGKILKGCDHRTWEGKRDEAILRLLVDSGGRAAEIAGLLVEQVSPQNGRITIIGKGDKQRIIPFRPETAVVLERYIRARRKHALASSPKLWLGVRATYFGYPALWAMVERRAKGAEIEGVHPHRFRRTFAHNWLNDGGSMDGLMTLAGWADMRSAKPYIEAMKGERAIEEHRRLYGE